MASASWTPAIDGSSATWDKNKARADLERAAPLYDDPTITYDSPLVYYNGYNPAMYTLEGETGTLWLEVSE